MSDLNILDCSRLFYKVRVGTWLKHKLELNIAKRAIDWFYWVVDGIYISHRIFLKIISHPHTKREKLFSKAQEGFRKVLERVIVVFLVGGIFWRTLHACGTTMI